MKSATRQLRRVRLNSHIKYVGLERLHPDRAANISEGGICISTPKPLEVGSHIHFKFDLPDLQLEVEAKGKVVWSRPGRGMGIQFDDDCKEIVSLLELYIDVENEVTSAFAAIGDLDEEADKPRLFN
jgi:uncharacterized protein (TIGR02266 family)